ncbi:MAG: hypothetical protein WA156_05990 [Methylocystis silviterrae]
MRDLFVVSENNLRRGANDAVDLDDVGRIVGQHPHARDALAGGRLLQGDRRRARQSGAGERQ